MRIDRRIVTLTYRGTVPKGRKLIFEKLSYVCTSRDKEHEGAALAELREQALVRLKACALKGYDVLFAEHARAWERKVWDFYRLEVDSEDGFDQLALRFALYHLAAMTPVHDERMGIGAKGLSGEGYKGHSFWDTEILIRMSSLERILVAAAGRAIFHRTRRHSWRRQRTNITCRCSPI